MTRGTELSVLLTWFPSIRASVPRLHRPIGRMALFARHMCTAGSLPVLVAQHGLQDSASRGSCISISRNAFGN